MGIRSIRSAWSGVIVCVQHGLYTHTLPMLTDTMLTYRVLTDTMFAHTDLYLHRPIFTQTTW